MGGKVRDDTGKICPSVRIVNVLSAGRGDLYQGMPCVLRALLNEAGQVAAQHDQKLGLVYRRLLVGRGHATVKVAVARRFAGAGPSFQRRGVAVRSTRGFGPFNAASDASRKRRVG